MTLTFEDFKPGHFGTFGPRHVTREEILAFAAEFDPQPMHLDEEAAKALDAEGPSGSGWHLCSIMMRMMFDGFIGRTASLGSPGVNELRWLAPLRPGDDLTLDIEVDGGADIAQPSRYRHRDVQGHGRATRPAWRCARWCRRSSCARRAGRGGGGGLMRFFEDIEVGHAARSGIVHLHRRRDQEIRRAIRSAALSSRRGGGPQLAVRRAGRVGLACRFGLHEADGGRRPAPDEGSGRARREGRGVGTVAGFSRTALDQAGAGRRHHQLLPARSNRCAPRRSGRNGASCRPARPAPTSAANWCISLLATAFVPRRNAGS